MPSNFLYIDTNFPTFTGEESSEEQIDSMLNYLRILVEQLRYTLNNLDMTNFNTKAISDWSEASTEEIVEQLVAVSAQLNQLSQAVTRLSSRVASLEGLENRMADAEDDIEDLKNADDALAGRITALENDTSSQGARISALELWKSGVNTDLGTLRTDVNSANASAAANALAISALQTDVTNIGNDLTALIAEVAQLKTSISVDSSGNAIFGKTGQRTDIKGDVYINNLPYI